MAEPVIPTVDLSPFLSDDEDGKKKAMEIITEACSKYGFFQIVNHGVSLDLMGRALEISKTFFDYSDEEKKKSTPYSNAPIPAGYGRQPLNSPDRNEYVGVYSAGSVFNMYPEKPPEFRYKFSQYAPHIHHYIVLFLPFVVKPFTSLPLKKNVDEHNIKGRADAHVKVLGEVLEKMFVQLSETGLLLMNIINECLGLPPNFLKEFSHDRSWDFMAAFHYFPTSNNDNTTGITEHEDSNLITFVIQDGVGGLQVLKNGEWIPVVPAEGTIVVNIGDVIQVLSNKKFKSATHRVQRTVGRSRYSYVFFLNLTGDKWVEPLPQFTIENGEPPKYRGFLYKEYQQLRMRNKTHPPSRPEDVIHITHYAIDVDPTAE